MNWNIKGFKKISDGVIKNCDFVKSRKEYVHILWVVIQSKGNPTEISMLYVLFSDNQTPEECKKHIENDFNKGTLGKSYRDDGMVWVRGDLNDKKSNPN